MSPIVRRNSALMQNAVSSVLLKPAISTRIFSYVHKKFGGKAVGLALLVAVVMAFGSFQLAKGQTITCNDDPCPGTSFVGTYSYTFVYPSFPGCTVRVRYERKKCPTPPPGKWYFRIIEIVVPNTSACSGFRAWLDASDANYQHIFEFASEAIAQKQLFPHDFPQHLTDPAQQCPYGTSVAETYYAGCNHYCIYDDNRPVGSGGTQSSYIINMDCGAYGKCCKAVITTCYDPSIGQIISYTTKTSIGGGIFCPILLSEICPSTYTIDNSPVTGGTYNLPLSKSTTGCIPNSCE